MRWWRLIFGLKSSRADQVHLTCTELAAIFTGWTFINFSYLQYPRASAVFEATCSSSQLNLIAPIAQDLLCSPASQAFVERMFSISGFMSSGRRSSMAQSLQMRVFLKINRMLWRLLTLSSDCDVVTVVNQYSVGPTFKFWAVSFFKGL